MKRYTHFITCQAIYPKCPHEQINCETLNHPRGWWWWWRGNNRISVRVERHLKKIMQLKDKWQGVAFVRHLRYPYAVLLESMGLSPGSVSNAACCCSVSSEDADGGSRTRVPATHLGEWVPGSWFCLAVLDTWRILVSFSSSSLWPLSKLIFKRFICWEAELQREGHHTHTQTYSSSISWPIFKWTQWPGLGQIKIRSLVLLSGLSNRCRGPSSWGFFCFARCVRRELDQK